MSCSITIDRPYSAVRIEALADETFDLPQQLFVVNPDGTQSPLDLTAGGDITTPVLDFYIRPRFNHSELVRRLSNDPDIGGLIVDDAANGKISFYLEQSVVETDLTVTDQRGWDCFLVWTIAPRKIELYRGSIAIYPARI
jgi:hypothetical protein